MPSLKKFLAKHCDNCPLCKHARKNPGTLFGKMMKLHGKFCPAWRAWEKEYGQKPEAKSS